MKKIKIVGILTVGILLTACDGSKSSIEGDLVSLNSFEEKISYSLGADLGGNFKNMPDEMFETMDTDALADGFYNGLTEKEQDRSDCQEILQAAFASPEGIDTTKNDMKTVSDCYGYIFGDMLRNNLDANGAYDKIDPIFAKEGFRLSLFEADTLIDMEERAEMVANFNDDMAKLRGEELMAEAKEKSGAIIDDKGFVLIEQKSGTGEEINPDNEFEIIYTMMKPNGDTIISTLIDPKMEESVNSQVINADDIVIPNGWAEAAEHMRVGGEYSLYLPYDLAYGERGLMNQNSTNYIIAPYTSVIISTKVLSQGPVHGAAKERGKKIIEDAKKKPNTKVGKSGYVLETLEKGSGPKVVPGSDVKAHYILTNSQGEVVENSYMGAQQGRDVPSFSLNSVIKGWQDAVPEMQKGGRYKLYLPYDIAYGDMGNQNIPPYETLTFEMEIVDFGEPGSFTQQQQQGQGQQFTEEQLKELQKQMQQQQQN